MDALRSRPVKPARAIIAAWLLLALVAALYCGWRFVATSPLQTNLLALLPPTEADPVSDLAVERLASALGDRTVYLVTSHDDAHAKAAATQLGATLAASHAFRSVTAQLPPFDLSQIGSVYLPYRFGLLTPADRAAIAQGPNALHDALLQRLYAPPGGGGLATPLADDPFGWLEHWLAGLPLDTSNLTIEDNLLVAHRHETGGNATGDTTSVLVVASLPGSAYESDTQRAVLAATANAEAGLKRAFPDVTLARTGAVFYGEAARSESERDVHRIGIVSLVGVALLMLWIFRSPRLLLLGFVSTAIGILCALAVTMLVFGKLHLLTLVFGASLIGEAVDYSIQYFVVYLGAHDASAASHARAGANVAQSGQWDARQGARAVTPALSVALATSLLGYAMLAWVPFPALKQIACFAMVGISVAFASVLWLLPALLTRAPTHPPHTLFRAAARLLERWHRAIGGARAGWLAALLVVIAAPGWLMLKSDDDIHLLIHRDPSLVVQEQRITHAVGVDNDTQFFVVRGDSEEAVLQRAEALGAKLDALTGNDATQIAGWQSVTSFVPSAQRQHADRALLESHVFNDRAALRALLVDAGFKNSIADGWLAAYAQSANRTLDVARWLAAPWSQPFRHLWLGQVQLQNPNAAPVYAAVVMPQRVTPANEPVLVALAATLPGVSFVDKAASVSKLFGAYRVDSGLWLAGALLLVLLLLIARYGVRGGIAVGLPVLLAVGVTLAVFGYARVPCNLFNSLALMLVLGVGANYAVFLREGAQRDRADLGAVWTGVLLSAATTLLSFGMLGMSSMPALKSFGGTLALGIAIAVLLAPIGIPSPREKT